MILTARRSLVQKMARHQTPQIEIFFLNISGNISLKYFSQYSISYFLLSWFVTLLTVEE